MATRFRWRPWPASKPRVSEPGEAPTYLVANHGQCLQVAHYSDFTASWHTSEGLKLTEVYWWAAVPETPVAGAPVPKGSS